MKPPVALSSVLDEWRKNPRLQTGGLIIIVILVVYILMIVSDYRQKVEGSYTALMGQWRRTMELAQEEGWSERMEAARTLRVQMEGRLWQAESQGLAQANVQTWVDELLKKNRIDNYRTTVDDALVVEGVEKVWQMAVRVEAPFEPNRFFRFLRAVETYLQLVTVEQLDIITQRKPRFVLVFKVYFRIQKT